jgi:two-component system, OmpR family, response regulator QseB
MKLLLVEDHPTMGDLIAAYLRERGFVVDVASRGEAALDMVAATTYDAAVLDLGLPDLDGMDVLRRLRAEHHGSVPVLILTARDGLAARLGGLNGGADDYLVKPFELAELEARLRAILRRPGPRGYDLYRFGNLVFDPASRTTTLDGTVVDLTRREISVLEEMMRANGAIVVKDALEDRLSSVDGALSENAVEAAVSRLRRKLIAAAANIQIEAVRGVGYRLKGDPRS